MNQYFLKSIFITLVLFVFSIYPDEFNWSENQGKLKWSDAKTRCTKLGMRLPSLEELKKRYDSDEASNWKKDGNAYWSSKEISPERAFYFTLLNGTSFSLFKNKSIQVRCVK